MKSELSTAAISRIAKGAGVPRVSEEAALKLAQTAEEYITRLVQISFEESKKAGRKTLKAEDIVNLPGY